MIYERLLHIARMPLQRIFNCFRLDPRTHSKVPFVKIAHTSILSPPHACIPQQHCPKIERPDSTFPTHGIVIQLRIRMRWKQ